MYNKKENRKNKKFFIGKRVTLNHSILTFTTLAGLPATIEFAGTSFVTTEHAATIALSPI